MFLSLLFSFLFVIILFLGRNELPWPPRERGPAGDRGGLDRRDADDHGEGAARVPELDPHDGAERDRNPSAVLVTLPPPPCRL